MTQRVPRHDQVKRARNTTTKNASKCCFSTFDTQAAHVGLHGSRRRLPTCWTWDLQLRDVTTLPCWPQPTILQAKAGAYKCPTLVVGLRQLT